VKTLSDLIDLFEEQPWVSALDVVRRSDLSLDEAGLLLSKLGVFTEDNYVYNLDGDVSDVREKLDMDASLRSVIDAPDPVMEKLESIEEKLDRLLTRKNLPKSTVRRRRRGELLEVTPADPQELREARVEATKEIAEAKSTRTTKEYQTVYARWVQRINALEKKYSVGVYGEDTA
jgi:hypothetical protein